MKGCGSLQTSLRLDSVVLRNRQQKHTAIRYKQAEKKDNDTMTMKFLLHKDKEKMNTYRTNGTFAFAPTHEANPSAKSKEPFFANAPRKICTLH